MSATSTYTLQNGTIYTNETIYEVPLAIHIFLRYCNLRTCCIIVYSIECAILFLALLNVSYFTLLLFQRKLLHVNFRILCFNDCLGSFAIIFIRYILTIEMLLPSIRIYIPEEIFKYLYSIGDGMLQFGVLNLAAILFERWWSTICAKNYEHYFKIFHIVGMVSSSWIISLTIAALMQIIPPDAFGILVGSLNAVFFTAFIILFVYNKRLLKQNEYKNLSHAFQVRENVRTIKLMTVLSILMIIHFVIAAGITLMVHQYDHNLKKANRYMFWKAMFNAFFATRCFILPNTVVCLFFRKRHNSIKCLPEHSYAVTDQSLLYFTELKRQWGILN